MDLSIIVPVYKVEPYLRRCVKSLMAQTCENYEVLLVDDGSPDSCPKICDDWLHVQTISVSFIKPTAVSAVPGMPAFSLPVGIISVLWIQMMLLPRICSLLC